MLNWVLVVERLVIDWFFCRRALERGLDFFIAIHRSSSRGGASAGSRARWALGLALH
jgi:hypothetical protein